MHKKHLKTPVPSSRENSRKPGTEENSFNLVGGICEPTSHVTLSSRRLNVASWSQSGERLSALPSSPKSAGPYELGKKRPHTAGKARSLCSQGIPCLHRKPESVRASGLGFWLLGPAQVLISESADGAPCPAPR